MTKIKKVEIYPLTIPYREPVRLSYGIEAETNNVFIKIYDENGVVGVGESTAFTKDSQKAVIADLEKIAPKLIGMDCFKIGLIHDEMAKIAKVGSSRCGIDMALYELMGNITGQPVYNLIGGCYRMEIPTQHALFVKSPEEMAADALKYVNEGYRILEIKLAGEPELDIERTRAIRKAVGPDVEMIMDPNSGWTVEESIYALNKMEELNIYIEEPTTGIDEHAEIRRAVNVPIVIDQSAQNPSELFEVIKKEAGDAVNIKIQYVGGLYPAKIMIAMCDIAGMAYRIDDAAPSRVGNTASAHLAASSKNIFGCGVAQHTFLDAKTVDLICEDGVQIDNGYGILSKRPGLGVTLKSDLIKKPVIVFT